MLKFQKRPRFGKWIQLEEQKNRILETVEESSEEFPDELFSFLSTVLHLSPKYFEKAPWIKVVYAFSRCLTMTRCHIELPILSSKLKEKPVKEGWDYPHRRIHVYTHMLAKTYGWTVEYIHNLRPEDALPKIQEIMLDEQLEKEWQWMLGEHSVVYDSTTKESKLNPLSRPDWMMKHTDPIEDLPKTMIPVNMIPQGKALTVDDILSKT